MTSNQEYPLLILYKFYYTSTVKLFKKNCIRYVEKHLQFKQRKHRQNIWIFKTNILCVLPYVI